MYRHILMAYDGTLPGREALRQGEELAVLCGAKITLFAVIHEPLGVTLAEAVAPSDALNREKGEIEGILRDGEAALAASGLAVSAAISFGEPAQEIRDMAVKCGADLIVLGHRPQGTVARLWAGSVGADLLADGPCSVLVAKPPPEPT